MKTPAIEELEKFIFLNELRRENGIILFDATVKCHKTNSFLKIDSQVQLILLPKEMAVYIVEFFKEEFQEQEMYSTAHYNFSCTEDKSLEITDDFKQSRFNISIAPRNEI